MAAKVKNQFPAAEMECMLPDSGFGGTRAFSTLTGDFHPAFHKIFPDPESMVMIAQSKQQTAMLASNAVSHPVLSGLKPA
ncbi:MAG: hypothetical protein WCD70_08465 [Alphaproteobacteria bacterium]